MSRKGDCPPETKPGTSGEKDEKVKVCTSCRKSSHPSKFSSKCENRIKTAAEANTGYKKHELEIYTVKCGLWSICKTDEALDMMVGDCDEVSGFKAEMAFFMEHLVRDPKRWLVKKWESEEEEPNLETMAMHLTKNFLPKKHKPSGEFVELLEGYKEWRDIHIKRPLYDKVNREGVYSHAVAEYKRLFATNITTHAWTRVRNYLRKMVGKPWKEAKEDAKELFDENKRPKVTEDAERNPFKGYEELNFTEVKKKWWKFVGFFQRVQERMLEERPAALEKKADEDRKKAAEGREKKLPVKKRGKPAPFASTQTNWGKGFVVVPIYSVGVSHQTYDVGAIREFNIRQDEAARAAIKGMKPKKERREDCRGKEREVWAKHFAIPEELQGVFTGSISTNGVDVSIHCGRPRQNKKEEDKKKKKGVAAKQRKLDDGDDAEMKDEKTDEWRVRPLRERVTDYRRIVGVDPGLRVACGMVARESDVTKDAVDKRGATEQIRKCFTSAEFHQRTGYPTREMRRKKLTREVDEKLGVMLEGEKFEGLNTKDPRDYERVTVYRMKHFALCQAAYARRSVTRVQWEKKWRTRREEDLMANEMATGKKQSKRQEMKKRKPRNPEKAMRAKLLSDKHNTKMKEEKKKKREKKEKERKPGDEKKPNVNDPKTPSKRKRRRTREKHRPSYMKKKRRKEKITLDIMYRFVISRADKASQSITGSSLTVSSIPSESLSKLGARTSVTMSSSSCTAQVGETGASWRLGQDDEIDFLRIF